MNFALMSLVLALHPLGAQTPVAPLLAATAECPAQTAQGRRLVNLYSSGEQYKRARERDRVRSAAPERVRPLEDGGACRRLLEILTQRAQSVGGSLDGSNPEFYTVGEFYYAVIPAGPSRCKPQPSRICIAGWQVLHVFDREFNLVGGTAM